MFSVKSFDIFVFLSSKQIRKMFFFRRRVNWEIFSRTYKMQIMFFHLIKTLISSQSRQPNEKVDEYTS